jgi:uncharacterized protein (DUF885 family)
MRRLAPVLFAFARPLLACVVACSPAATTPAGAAGLGGATADASPIPAPAATASAAPPSADTADDAAIDRAAGDYLDLLIAFSPETATALGVHSRDTDLDGYSREEEEATLKREEAMLADLRARFPAPRASRSKKTDLALIESALAVDVRWRRTLKPLERMPDAYSSPMWALFQMAAHEYAPAADRAHASLVRIEKVPTVVGLARINLKAPPRVWVQIGIEEAESAGEFFEDERAFLTGALGPEDKPRIEAAITSAKKAYADYAAFLKKEMLPHAGGDFAAGRELFTFLLHDGYFLEETPDQLYALGASIFDRTQTEMDAVAKRIDPKAASWPEVTRKVKAHHPTAEDLIPSYRHEVERARRFLVDRDVVPFAPGDDCQVVETPPFLRTTTTASYEQAPPLDPETRGLFFVTPVDAKAAPAQKEQMLREHDHGDQVDTVVHETYPGHHLQLSFSRTYPSLIRKMTDAKRAAVIGQDVFAEGWGLYAEELMNELGYYTDEERLMQLEWTLVRAARVMIDVGLHTRGMTFDDAVKMLTDRVHLEKVLATSEVKRYTETPTQPLAYLVGRERIVAMRERYRARAAAAADAGASFLKAFHTEVLSHGTIAPGLIEREIFE